MHLLKVSCLVFLLLLIGCNSKEHFEPREGKDVFVVKSSDGEFVALVREINIDGSVMVSQPYQVILGSSPSDMNVVLEVDKTNGLVLEWKGSNLINICYGKETRIWKFRNQVFLKSDVSSAYRDIEIILSREESVEKCVRVNSTTVR